MGSILDSTEDNFAVTLAKYGVKIENFSEQKSYSPVSTLVSLYPNQCITNLPEIEAWRKQLFSMHQQAVTPAIIFQPTSAKEIAITILLCRRSNLKFAVKCGGHAAMKGASNIQEGVTIDLTNLDSIVLNEDKSIAKISAGNKWKRVYEVLAQDGLAVAGGRSGEVGVGGYSLGGGISFFASARGWACDNIRNYELVTASGDIINVNRHSYPDLFWALRGGGTNFGIVTRFDYETFPQTDVYGGSLFYDYEYRDSIVKAFTSFAYDSDPKTATWLTSVFNKGKSMFSVIGMYADPTEDNPFTKTYSTIPSLHDTQKVRSIVNMVNDIDVLQATEHRQNYWNHTFKFDIDFVNWLIDMYYTEFSPYEGKYETDQGSVLVMQYYTKEAVRNMQLEGGNCLSLQEDEAPYLNVLIPTAWKHKTDDEFVLGIVKKMMDLAVEEGKRRGLYVDFVYMNYGSAYQDVLKSYGKKNYDRLKGVASKYDPEGVFQTLMPGYFKFGGAPL